MFATFSKLTHLFQLLNTGILLGIPGEQQQYRFKLVRKANFIPWYRLTPEPMVAVHVPEKTFPPPEPIIVPEVMVAYHLGRKEKNRRNHGHASISEMKLTQVYEEMWQAMYRHLLENFNLAVKYCKVQTLAQQARKAVQVIVDEALASYRTAVAGSLILCIDSHLNAVLNNLAISAARVLSYTDNSDQRILFQVLPEHTRLYYGVGEGEEAVVLEIPPHCRTLTFSRNMDWAVGYYGKEEDAHFHLALPYTVFVVRFSQTIDPQLSIFWRNEPLGSMGDKLYEAVLPNIFLHGRVCLGNYRPLAQGSLAERVGHVVSFFWQSRFNNWLHHNYTGLQRQDTRLIGFAEWERRSKKNPAFVLGICWPSAQTTIGELWLEQCADLCSKLAPSDMKAVVNKAMQSAKEEMVLAISRHCDGISCTNQNSGSNFKHLVSLLTRLVEEVAAYATSELGTEAQRKKYWKHFLLTLNKVTGMPILREKRGG